MRITVQHGPWVLLDLRIAERDPDPAEWEPRPDLGMAGGEFGPETGEHQVTTFGFGA